MMTLKQLISLDVYDEKGTNWGQIRDVAFDKATGKCLIVTDGGAYFVDGLTANGKRAAASNLRKTDKAYPDILGVTAYDTAGKLLGTAVNATIGRTATLGKIHLDNGDIYNRGQIAAVNDILLIKLVKRAQKTQQHKLLDTETRTKAQQSERAQINVKAVDITANSRSVRRRYGDFSFLLGKTADKNITNFFGEVMIHAGETVTLDILRQAKISGKLIELCLHAK